MKKVVRCLHDFYKTLDDEPIIMSAAATRRMKEICFDFGEAFMQCREKARVAGELSWEITPKVHKMMHVPQQCAQINPRCVSCYADESAIGSTTRAWKRSMSGRYKAVAQRSVLAKRVVGVLVRFE